MSRKDKALATPQPKISQSIKIAGSTGGSISKRDLGSLSKDSGRSGAQLVQRLDKINANLKEKGKVGINLSSGAANMLIRQASKAAPTYDNFLGLGKSAFGTGKIGKTLQGMVGSRSTGGYINPQSGQQSRSAAVGPTFLARGMDLMPGGRQTVRGVGKQFEYQPSPKGPYDGMSLEPSDPNGPGPWAPKSTGEEITDDPITKPMTPEEMEEASTIGGSGSMSGGGMGAAGANKLGRAKSRLRQLGIYGRGTSLLGRGLQYGNVLNK